ncbi:MAG: hypothetical protein WDW36_004975 [Sanguina aurantia]
MLRSLYLLAKQSYAESSLQTAAPPTPITPAPATASPEGSAASAPPSARRKAKPAAVVASDSTITDSAAVAAAAAASLFRVELRPLDACEQEQVQPKVKVAKAIDASGMYSEAEGVSEKEKLELVAVKLDPMGMVVMDKFVGCIMKQGKRSVAQNIMLRAMLLMRETIVNKKLDEVK